MTQPRRYRRRGPLLVAAVVPVIALIGASAQAVAFARPASWHKPPKPDTGVVVKVSHLALAPTAENVPASWSPKQAAMPAAGTYAMSLAAAPTRAMTPNSSAGLVTGSAAAWSAVGTTGLAIRAISATAGQHLTVSVLDASGRRQHGLNGLAVSLQRTGGTAGSAQVRVPAALLNNLYGGDYAGRIRWVELPTTGPGPAADVPASNVSRDASGNTLISAPVSSRAMVLAATSGPTSAQGSGTWAATDLKPSGQWGASTQTGSFTYSYPMATPPAAAGPSPNLSLSYDSGSVDGETGSTNNQPSAIGEGWSLTGGGYIERRYVSCADDNGATGPVTTSGDLCWKSDNGVLSFGGHSGTLVKDGNPGEWRLQDDDGTIVKELSNCGNTTTRKDCWEVVTTDGTQYYFGKNQLPGYTNDTATPPTNSVWTVPVFGNDPGEPGYNGAGGTAKGTFATEATSEAWRWNLDYVVDPHGNAEALYYTAETNDYAQNGSGATSYVRGGQLARIDYGLPASAIYTAGGPADRVTFAYAERCKTGQTCSSASPTTMPDVPWDQNCTTSPCTGKVSPTFWSEKMLTAVTTQIRTSATGYSNVSSWAMTHDYPATGDQYNPPALWLSQVQQTGSASGSGTVTPASITQAPTVFKPTASGMTNRVWVTDGLTQLAKNRITEIDTSTGALETVLYAQADPACTYNYGQTTLKTNPDTDTHLCFLQWWTPQVTPPQPAQADLFQKYVVSDVKVDPHTGGTGDQPTETQYSYGTPAWRYDNSPFVADKYRGWSVFAGFNTAEVRVGDAGTPSAQQVTDYTYYQGMDGDHLNNGSTRSAVVTDSYGTQVADSRWLAGQIRETRTPNPAGGPTPLSDTVTTPWASIAHADDGVLQARVVGDGDTRTITPVSTGGTRTIDVTTTHDDDTGLVRSVSNVSTDAGSTCTRTTYAQNTAARLMAFPSEVATVGVACTATPSYPADAISDIRTAYDGQATGVAPVKGDVTTMQRVTGYTGTTAGTATWQTTATNVYDSLGRLIQATDQLGRVTKTAYNPDASGNNQTTQPTTAVTTTTDAQAGGLGWVTKATYNPAWGAQISATDLNGEITTITYDALGRRRQVWLPDRAQATYPSAPSTSYSYTDYVSTAPAALAVATTKLTPTGAAITSYAIYDGLGRARQAQSWMENKNSSGNHILAGTIVSDTFYDSAGRTYLTSSPFGSTNPGPSAVLIDDLKQGTVIPAQTQTTFDAAGRPTASIQLVNNNEVWRTSYNYASSDRVDLTPPAGGTPTSTFTDSRGRTSALWQYNNTNPTGTALVTSYGYDARGSMTSMTDATRSNTWSWKFDSLGRQIEAVDPDTGTTDTTYDAADRVQTVTSDQRQTTGSSPARVTLAYSYDDANRKTGEYLTSTSGTQLAGWTYDATTTTKGQLASSSSYSGADTFTTSVNSYDALYRPRQTTTTIPTDAAVTGSLAGSYVHNFSYNADGSLAYSTDPAEGGLPAEKLVNAYTQLGNPIGLGGYMDYLADVSYTSNNLIAQENITDGNSEMDRTFYLATGTNRLTRLLTTTSASSHFTPADNNYTYDNAGNVLSDSTYSDTGTDLQCYSYDHLQQLTAAWSLGSGSCGSEPTAASSVSGLAPYWTDYGYDNTTGNRASVISHNLTGGSDATAAYHYPAAGSAQPHVLGSITYSGAQSGSDTFASDPAGESITRPGQTLTYTPQGRLGTVTAAGSVQSNLYDADGNLLLTLDPAHGNTLYLGDTQLHTPAGAPGGTVTGVRTYTALGTPMAERATTIGGPANGTTKWLNADRNNTVTDELTNVGLTLTTRHYDPFGNPIGTAPAWSSTHTYLNGDTNNQTNTVHLGARDYDPTLGRFLTADPVFSPKTPLQDNGYSYALNGPITQSDPSGMCPKDTCGDGGPAGNMSHGYHGDAGGSGTTSAQDCSDLNQGDAAACNVGNGLNRTPAAPVKLPTTEAGIVLYFTAQCHGDPRCTHDNAAQGCTIVTGDRSMCYGTVLVENIANMIMVGLYKQKLDPASFKTSTGTKLGMLSAGLAVGGMAADGSVVGIPVGVAMEVASVVVGGFAAYADCSSKDSSGAQCGIDIAATALGGIGFASKLAGDGPSVLRATASVLEATEESPFTKSPGELLDMVFGIESLNLAALGVVNGAIDDNR